MQNNKNFERLNHLINILRNLSGEEARWILANLEEDIRFDREKLNYLAKNIFNPLDLFKELSLDELKLLFQALKAEVLFPVFNQKAPNQNEILELTHKIFTPNKLEDIKSVTKPEPIETATEKILDRLFKLIAEGKIAYNGICSYIHPSSCRPEGEEKPEKLIFQTLNPIVSFGEGLKILVYAPGHGSTKARISLQTTGNRFFKKENWLHYIPLDGEGLFFGEIFPDRIDGPATVWLDIPDAGETCRTVFFAPSARTLFSIDILGIECNETKVTLSTKLISKEKMSNQDLRFIVYCSRCGSPISISHAEIVDGKTNLTFSAEHLKKHPHDYYLHAFCGGHQSGMRFNIFQNKESIESIELSNRKPGESVQLKLKNMFYQKVFYHVSISEYIHRKLENLLDSSQVKLYGAAQKNFNRKSSPLELAISEQEITLLSEFKTNFEFGVKEMIEKDDFSYTPKGLENISNLFLTFYKFTKTGFVPFLRCKSVLTKEPIIYPLLPTYIESDEQVEIDLGYSVSKSATIVITNGKIETKEIQGKGILPIWIGNGHSTEVELKTDEHITKYVIQPNPRKIERITVKYCKPGTIIPKNESEVEFYKKPDDLYDFFLNELLLSYPWGCGEQTAAKIAGFCLVLLGLLPVAKDHRLIFKLQEGVKTLQGFRYPEGYYAIFQGNVADINTTGIIYNNLNLISKERGKLDKYIPELFVMIDEMKDLLSGKDISRLGKGRTEVISLLPVLNVDELYTNKINQIFPKLIQFESGKLTKLNEGYQSLVGLACIAATSLIKNKTNQISVFGGKKRIQTEIQSNGFRGFLESIGLLKRKINSKEKILTKEIDNALEYLLPACNLSYFKNGYPSTIDISGMLVLLTQIKKLVPTYKYNPQSADSTLSVEVGSPYTFIKQIKGVEFAFEKNKGILTLSRHKVHKGETFSIEIERHKAKGTEIYYLLLPACVEPVCSQFLVYSATDQKISFHPFAMEQDIYLQAVRKGIGKLQLIIEKMNDTSSAEYIELGKVEVV